MGNIHVANGSRKTLRVRVAQERVTITNIELSGSASARAFALAGSVKASLDHELDTTGFARLGPAEALEFDVDETRGDVFVSVTTADDPEPLVIAYNFSPPAGRSVIITDKWTLQLAQKHGDVWRTDSGVCYGPDMAKLIQKQSAGPGTRAADKEQNEDADKSRERCCWCSACSVM